MLNSSVPKAVAASRLRLLLRTLSGFIVLQRLGSVMMSMDCVAIKGHMDA